MPNIHNNISCKTLFSTHYHELTDLEKTLPNLKNKHVSAKEENGNIKFAVYEIEDVKMYLEGLDEIK